MLIKLTDITKTYHSGEILQPVLKGINLEIFSGELLAIMGASGSGKSTLMNILGMLDTASSGSYTLQGKDVTTLDEKERANLRNHMIGLVFQSFYLLPRLTILENVGLPLHYRHLSESECNRQALNLLKKVGLEHLAARKPNQLSGGQQQRVAIARALIGNPSFIIADEPTGSLDSTTGKMIMDTFLELNKQEKVTIIIITHDSRIAERCQRIAHIEDGQFHETSFN